MLTSSPYFRAGGCQFYDDKRPFIDWVVDLLDGEHFSRERNVREYDGSSPQAWGTPERVVVDVDVYLELSHDSVDNKGSVLQRGPGTSDL